MKKWFTRWSIASIFVSAIIVSVVVCIESLLTDNKVNSVISGIIFVALGLIVAILQWLFPLQTATRLSTQECGFLIFLGVITLIIVSLVIAEPMQLYTPSIGGGSEIPVATIVTPSSKHTTITKNMSIPCISCLANYSLGVTLSTIELDLSGQQTKLSFTLTNQTGNACANNSLYQIQLEDILSGQTSYEQGGTAGELWTLAANENVSVYSVFAVVLQSGRTYTLSIWARVCGTDKDYQTETLTL